MPVKPVVVVTRKLPDPVETRMMELFDVRLNLSDTPMTQARLIEAVKSCDVLVPTVTDRIDAAVLSQAGERLKLIASFGTGVDHIDLKTARQRGISVTNTPGVLTEDTADMTMVLILAVPRRLAEGERLLRGGAWTGWSPTFMLGKRIWGKRLGIVGMGRIGSAARARLRARHPLSQPAPGASDRRAGARGHLLGEPRPDAVPDGHHLGQLPAHPGHFPSSLGPAPKAPAEACLYRQHLPRRGDRRDGADPDAGEGRARRRRPRRLRA